MAYYLGIDLGTTYTAAAKERGGTVEAITLGNRSASVPSVVFLRDDGETLVGEAATRRATTEPNRVAREFKRRVGDPTPIIIGGTPYSAERLMARVLRWALDKVRQQEGGPPQGIALTHPANWGPYKLDLFQQAIRHVDVEPDLLLPEPVAAATFYASQRRLDDGAVVAVYDLGGGTFDAAMVRRTANGFESVGSPEGIERLGGIDFDEAVLSHVRTSLRGAIEGLDPEEPAAVAALTRLRQECIDAKEGLSSDTDVSIPVLLPGIQTDVRLTRSEFEDMIRPAINETIVALRRAVRSAQVSNDDITAVLLVGGSSRIPLVAQMVAAELGRPIAIDAHPKDAISFGAAIAVAEQRGQATPESVTTVLPADPQPAPPTMAQTGRPRPAPPRPQAPVAPGGPGAPGVPAAGGIAAAGAAGVAAAAAAYGTPGAAAGAGAAPSPGLPYGHGATTPASTGAPAGSGVAAGAGAPAGPGAAAGAGAPGGPGGAGAWAGAGGHTGGYGGGAAGSYGNSQPVASSSGGYPAASAGQGPSRNIWIAIGVIVVATVAVIAVIASQGSGSDQAGNDGNDETTTTTAGGAGDGYNAQLESDFVNACGGAGVATPDQCQCIYGQLEANLPYSEFVQLNEQVAQMSPEEFPDELINAVNTCLGVASTESGA
jgi:actin-like ATPase involved in cell morphogenesis